MNRHANLIVRLLTFLVVLALGAVSVGTPGAAPAAAGASQLKVAYIPIGPITDKSWSQSGYEGLVKAKNDLGVQIAYSDEGVAPVDAERVARGYAQQGYGLILLHGGQYADTAVKVAKDYPQAWFCVAGGNVTGPNVCSYDPQQQEGSFLAGALAALVSRTGRVGLIGGFAFPALTRQLEGFKLGARFVKPGIKIQEVYINTWDDVAKGRNAAISLIDSGADVLFAATDKASQGIFTAAAERHVYAIASYADQNSLQPSAILASVLYDLSGLVYKVVTLDTQGKLEGQVYKGGLAQGVGRLVWNDRLGAVVTPAIKARVAALQSEAVSGKLRIPSTQALAKPGAAATINPQSLLAK